MLATLASILFADLSRCDSNHRHGCDTATSTDALNIARAADGAFEILCYLSLPLLLLALFFGLLFCALGSLFLPFGSFISLLKLISSIFSLASFLSTKIAPIKLKLKIPFNYDAQDVSGSNADHPREKSHKRSEQEKRYRSVYPSRKWHYRQGGNDI